MGILNKINKYKKYLDIYLNGVNYEKAL